MWLSKRCPEATPIRKPAHSSSQGDRLTTIGTRLSRTDVGGKGGMVERTAFDVAVVGGGAAGCVVAGRLAETGSRSVVLLEAGPDRREDPPVDVRDGWSMTSEFDWGYVSEPDMLGVVRKVRRVKLLGGTSSITRFALRGSPADYDEWVALGN